MKTPHAYIRNMVFLLAYSAKEGFKCLYTLVENNLVLEIKPAEFGSA